MLQILIDSVYNERKQKNLSVSQVHDFILGTENWDIYRPLIDFVSSLSNEPGMLSNYTTENTKGQTDETEDFWLPEVPTMKQYICKNSVFGFPKIEDTEGLLLSPDFPQDYPNDSYCGWDLKVPAGSHLTLQFWAFDIEVKIMIISNIIMLRLILIPT